MASLDLAGSGLAGAVVATLGMILVPAILTSPPLAIAATICALITGATLGEQRGNCPASVRSGNRTVIPFEVSPGSEWRNPPAEAV
jgi:hypothetical protein